MLTLHRTDDAVPLVDIFESKYHGKGKLAAKTGQRAKKSSGTVYFTHEMADENGLSADAAGVLQLHRDTLKKEMHLAQPEFDAICKMIDRDDEPAPDHPLRHEFWDLKGHYDSYLKREMFLGDTDNIMFELNVPESRDDWPGTHTLIGNSGAGKTRYLTDMLLRYLKKSPAHLIRPIFWLSPEQDSG